MLNGLKLSVACLASAAGALFLASDANAQVRGMGGRHFGGMGFVNPSLLFRPGTTLNLSTATNGPNTTTTFTFTRPTASSMTNMTNLAAFHRIHHHHHWNNPYFGATNPYTNMSMNPLYNPALSAALYSSLYGGGMYGGGGYLGSAYSSNPYVSSLAYGPSYSPTYDRYTAAPAADYAPAMQTDRLAHALNNATDAEIASGQALNDILTDIEKMTIRPEAEGFAAVALTMTDDQLDQLNVAQGSGNMAALKKSVQTIWPAALNGDDLAETRNRLERLRRGAGAQVRTKGKVEADTLRELTDVVNRLDRYVRESAMPFEAHQEAKAFLRSLDAAIVALQQPDAQRQFSGTYTLRATTVGELVKKMADNKLQFAAALPGNEATYASLHKILAAYDRDLRTYINGKQPTIQ